MVDKTTKSQTLDILEVRTREKILHVLYDEKERSAYKIAREIDMATATTIGHLNKLEDAEMIRSKDATKGRLQRRYYKITERGKKTLLAFLKEYANEIKRNREIAKTLAKFLG